MTLRSMLAGTALAAIALAGAPQIGLFDAAPRAEAAVNVSIGIFYDQLGQYGDWVNYHDDYVFIPARVRADWRPYTLGHWVYTKRYGWTWASDEPFGWATYHYGRWGYAEDIGWYWVPGKRWAPAWVSWRRSKNYVVWAPLPPTRHRGADVAININVRDIPDYYWVAVPTRHFLAPDLRVEIVNDDREIRQVVRSTKYIGTPRVTNNIVINNVIDVDIIARETGERVRPVEVRTTDKPTEAKASADQVTVFEGEIATDTKAKPPKVSDAGQVRKVKRNQAGAGAGTTDQTTTDQTTTVPAANGSAVPLPDANTTTGAGTAEKPATDEASTPPATGKGKKKVNTGTATTAPADTTTGQSTTPDASSQQTSDQQQTGKKKKLQQDENAAAPATGEQPAAQAQDQQTGKKKKKQAGEDSATGSTTPAPDSSGNGAAKDVQSDQNANAPADGKAESKGKGKKEQTCDPATDASCAPAQ